MKFDSKFSQLLSVAIIPLKKEYAIASVQSLIDTLRQCDNSVAVDNGSTGVLQIDFNERKDSSYLFLWNTDYSTQDLTLTNLDLARSADLVIFCISIDGDAASLGASRSDDLIDSVFPLQIFFMH